jgi:hypothetical protein
MAKAAVRVMVVVTVEVMAEATAAVTEVAAAEVASN